MLQVSAGEQPLVQDESGRFAAFVDALTLCSRQWLVHLHIMHNSCGLFASTKHWIRMNGSS
jgi:hypothetical protein